MERRILLFLALSTALFVVWTWIFPPPKPPVQPPRPAQVSEGTPPAEVPAGAPAGAAAPAPAQPTNAPGAISEPVVTAEHEEAVRVTTDLLDVALTNLGGRVKSWRLKAYPTGDRESLELVPQFADPAGNLPFGLDLDDAALAKRANEALFRVEREELPAAEGSARGERIRFVWVDGNGVRISKQLTFHDGDYLVDVAVEVTDRGQAIPARLAIGPGFAARDGNGATQFHYQGQAVFNDRGLVTRLPKTKAEGELKLPADGLVWAGLEEQYFAAIVLPAAAGGSLVIRPFTPASPAVGSGDAKPGKELVIAVPIPAGGARVFVGPKKFTLLRSLGSQLEEVVWISNYRIVSTLGKLLFQALLWIHDRVVPNYGLAVILLTMTLRLALFPLNQYSMVSMRKTQAQMARIQPKIAAIRNKYGKKKDAESRGKVNQETMALYQKEGINPMGGVTGCIPMMAQFPILIAFYDMLIAAVELRGAPFFGWIHDLTQKDPYYITPLLMGATMFIQQKMGTTKVTDPQQAQQQKIMLMMPVVFTVMFLNLPAGLVLYWLVNNLLGIAQQWLVNRHMGRLDAAAPQKA